MKKIALILLAVVLAGTAALSLKMREVRETADKVEYTETILYGDRSILDGLDVSLYIRKNGNDFLDSQRKYLWISDLSFRNSGLSYDTKFDFSDKKEYRELPEKLYVEYAYYHDEQMDKKVDLIRKEHAEEIEKKGSVTVRMWYAGLMDNHKLEFALLAKGDTNSQKAYSGYELYEALKNYFRIPVLDTEMVELNISKTNYYIRKAADSEAESSQDEYFFHINSCSRAVDGQMYFSFNIGDEDGWPVAGRYSEIPGGHGVYRFKFEYDEDGNIVPDKNTIETVCSFEERSVIIGIEGSNKDGIIYVFALEGDRFEDYVLYRVDTKGEGKPERIVLGRHLEGRQSVIRARDGAYMVCCIDASSDHNNGYIYCFKEDENGFPGKVITVDLSKVNDLVYANIFDLPYIDRFDWMLKDGKLYIIRPDMCLARTALEYRESYYPLRCGISVIVFDEKGLCFFGDWKSSLGQDVTGRSLCTLDREKPFTWNFAE